MYVNGYLTIRRHAWGVSPGGEEGIALPFFFILKVGNTVGIKI